MKSSLIFFEKTGAGGGLTQDDYQRQMLEGHIGAAFRSCPDQGLQAPILQEDNDGARET